MDQKDIYKAIQKISEQLGYKSEYVEESNSIYIYVKDSIFEVWWFSTEYPYAISIFSSVIDLDASFESDAVANLINLMNVNVQSENCTFIISEDLDNRSGEHIPITIKYDLYILSMSHLKKSFPLIIDKMLSQKDIYIKACSKAMAAVGMPCE